MRILYFLSAMAALTASTTVWAAGAKSADSDKAQGAESAAADSKATAGAAKESKVAEVTTKDFMTTTDESSPVEKPNQTYYFVGVRFREVLIPQFMMSLFADGGTTVGLPMVGPEFTIRKNGFEYVLSLTYASYGMDWTTFKAKSDPPTAYELVKSNMGALYLMSDFLWSTDLNKQFAVEYGAGLGLGVIFGDLNRVQAKPGDGPNGYVQCARQGDDRAGYCDNSNDHYGNYSEPSWANGGSKPIVFPWLAVQTGFRFKPHRHFMARFDIGWNLLNGPFLGIAGNYGL